MNTPAHPDDLPDADSLALVDELRERLQAARTQEVAARGETRRLSRELALTHRLLRCYLGALPPARAAVAPPADGSVTTLLSTPLVYHLDSLENQGTRTAISGWAFRAAPNWDARATSVTVLLRHEDTVYATPCRAVRRADVAAFYAGQPADASGGATGLDAVGFACEVQHEALPAGTAWKVILRLECAGQACEQFTGELLRL